LTSVVLAARALPDHKLTDDHPYIGQLDLMPKITAIWALLFSLLPGCVMDEHQYSTDVAAFRNLIDTPVTIQRIRWEVFNTHWRVRFAQKLGGTAAIGWQHLP
jgi:hypothetical protein